jgi:hypothetical protein
MSGVIRAAAVGEHANPTGVVARGRAGTSGAPNNPGDTHVTAAKAFAQ